MENRILILVVDDEHGMRSGLADVLEEKGYQVSTAESGYQALERAERIPFHLIIADLRMPGLAGVEMIEKLKEIEQEANTAEEILSLIRSSQSGMTLTEVAIALPHNFEEISGTINKLAGEGKLEKEGKLYKATG